MAVVTEGRTHAEVAAEHGVSRSWVTRLVGRYRAEGEAAFEPRSRRPISSPTKIDSDVTDLIVNLRQSLTDSGLDAGPHTIRWHLETHHGIVVSVSTIRRRLLAAGLIEPAPKKRPKSSYTRFEAELPNQTWQSDFTHVWLADRTHTEIITWLDDHSRYALHVSAHRRITGRIVVETFNKTADQHGFPASTLTDNGMVYTTRFSGGKGGRNAFETTLADLGITQKNSSPNHPTTCGKVERFQQTMKKWLTARPPANTLNELQTRIDNFVNNYNHHRPHRSLDRTTPAIAYKRLPQTGPTNNGAGPHYRIRRDRIDKRGAISLRRAGRMHHIGIGRAHKATPVILLIDDLDIRVIATETGELLRHLKLNPNIGYQPQPKNQETP